MARPYRAAPSATPGWGAFRRLGIAGTSSILSVQPTAAAYFFSYGVLDLKGFIGFAKALALRRLFKKRLAVVAPSLEFQIGHSF